MCEAKALLTVVELYSIPHRKTDSLSEIMKAHPDKQPHGL